MDGLFSGLLGSAAEARAAGHKHYFTGNPCGRGHIDVRFTSIQKCKACAREDAMALHVHTTGKRRAYSDLAGFVGAAVVLHAGRYDYSRAVYAGAHTPLAVQCPEHGQFYVSPTNHMQGKGCPLCGSQAAAAKQRHGQAEVFARFQSVHGKAFDYSQSTYKGMQHPMQFRCREHGTLLTQLPTNHLSGQNPCPKCNHMKSKGEEQVFDFLSTLTTAESRNRTILRPRALDIYLPDRKMAVEYCGEMWHSHGDAADEKAKKLNHAKKYEDCKAQGIRLITLWESEWKEHNYAVRRLLRNAVGKSKGKLMARKCELRKVTTTEARPFYERYHPQGGAGHGEHYALFWKGKMVACMRFVLGANDRGAAAANRTWTLGRYATRVTVAGAASRLFKAFLAEYNHPEVKSFSDNRFFDGGMYAQLGFVLEEDVAPDYTVWHPKLGIHPKSHYQRRQLPKRMAEVGIDEPFAPDTDPRTEREMTYLMGARRLYDCGKKRWVYNPPTPGLLGVSDGPGRRQAD